MHRHIQLVENAIRYGIGLYRISYEGKFELECRYGAQILTMTARRRML